MKNQASVTLFSIMHIWIFSYRAPFGIALKGIQKRFRIHTNLCIDVKVVLTTEKAAKVHAIAEKMY